MVKYIITLVIIILPLKSKELNNTMRYHNDDIEEPCIDYENYPNLYSEGWDTLNQIVFWRNIIKMTPDSGLLNINSSRKIIQQLKTSDYTKLNINRDSIRLKESIRPDDRILFTNGKNNFYDFENAIPLIKDGVDIFKKEGTDPFYAHVILLIESPGRCDRSHVGAVGSFQLMGSVATSMGLKIGTIDERKDFRKSAIAAAKFIRTVCIPQTKDILDSHEIKYKETDIWFRLLVLHVYHAGSGNVRGAVAKCEKNENIIHQLWNIKYKAFGNASQNYTQIAIASILEYEDLVNCFD
jgi:hypothetical protein